MRAKRRAAFLLFALVLVKLIPGASCASVTITGSSASNWPSTGGSSIYLTGQINSTNVSCAQFKVRAGGTSAFATRWASETSIVFLSPAAASSRMVFIATASTNCISTDLPAAVYPVTSLEFTKVVAGQGMGCAITSGGALYCWGCFSGASTGPAPLWRNVNTRDNDVSDSYHCISDSALPAGPVLPTLVAGMESGVSHVTHLSTMGQYQTKQHMGLALKSGTVYELYLGTSGGLGIIASRIKSSFRGFFTVVADTRQQGNPYACALRGASVYCRADDAGTDAAPISGLPIDFIPISVHCSYYWSGWTSQHCCTYNSDGIVYCWGMRNGGCVACNRLGDIGADISTNSINIAVHATIVSSTSITVASGQPLVVSMDIGYVATYVVGGDGSIYCWSCRNSMSALTKFAYPPAGQKYIKLASYHDARICAVTNVSSLFCAIVPSTSATSATLANMIQVTSVRNFKREIVPLASASSGVIDVSCSKNFGAGAGPYLACCIIVRSSLGSNSGTVHCSVRAKCTCFVHLMPAHNYFDHFLLCTSSLSLASVPSAFNYAPLSHRS